ncbi:transposase, IS5 family [Pseudomonas panipatensis]|uniref:Transposase, IS5 family n=1 Tax=Pseudomonas panipatensis TaxID=428992 RepID=A0A1G8FSG1_9PSED|nr:transposase, IS5 family [Pseudomonas panipatensis]SMP52415.1 hypothetical protein SAMN06295951_10333 [Pseudomonas panipatensis]
MKQLTCVDTEYAGKCKQTRKELLLIEMDQVRLQRSGDAEDAVWTTILCQFAGLSMERISDETTVLNLRRFLEKHGLAAGIFGVSNGYLGDRGLLLRRGTIVNATLIQAPNSTQKQDGKRAPERTKPRKVTSTPSA